MTWHRLLLAGLVHLALVALASPAASQDADDGTDDTGSIDCPDADGLGAALVNNVCYDCIFPIRIAGVDISLGDSFAPPRRRSAPAAIASASPSECGSPPAWSNSSENLHARRP